MVTNSRLKNSRGLHPALIAMASSVRWGFLLGVRGGLEGVQPPVK